jgi:hypothetical protein
MLRSAALAGAVILSVSCNRSEGGDIGPLTSGSGSAKAGSGGGFSADLAKELGAGSAGSAAGSGDSKSAAGAAASGDAKPAAAAASGDAKPAAGAAGSGDAKPAAAASGDAKPAAASGDAKPAAAGSGDAKPAAAASDARPGAKTDPPGKPVAGRRDANPAAAASPPAPHGPVKLSAELAAIKLSLLPNWDRDIDEAGTFQYVVRIKGTQSTKTFVFHYGYDDPKAPVDHDQYKKYLQDTKVMTGEIRDRQRGAAWFLEASDGDGMPAFRYIVLYGGKRLICYGSLYKDADSSKLGDDRDQTVIQAKQICETLAL